MNRTTTYPSTKLTREELLALALEGAAKEVREMERRLARLHREFPAAFATKEPPVFAAAEAKPNGRELPLTATTGHQKAWTPERRAKQAEVTRARSKDLQRARKRAHRKRARTAPITIGEGLTQATLPVWHRMVSYLGTREDHRATSKEIVEALGLESSQVASLTDAMKRHPDLFRRIERGVYALTKKGALGNGTGAEA